MFSAAGNANALTDPLAAGVPSSPSGPLAQLARAPASHAGGHWFKSSTVHALTCGYAVLVAFKLVV